MDGIRVLDKAVATEKADGTHFENSSTQKRVEELIASRQAARAAKNFAEADKVRDQLADPRRRP